MCAQDTDMDPLVEIEAKLHITNGIEKASGATGVDIKVSKDFLKNVKLMSYLVCVNSKHAKS